MPSDTFFHLPAAKREKLLTAARAEFSRAPYGETSINRIIRDADIPRGSFYMYFTDKEDLFRYLMRSYGERVEALTVRLLEENGGDLFAAVLGLFDHAQAHWQQEEYQELAQILRRNEHMRPNIFLDREESCFLQRLRDKIDLSRLDLREEGDLAGIFYLLVTVAGGALMSAMTSGYAPEARARLVQMLDMLKRGIAREPARKEKA